MFKTKFFAIYFCFIFFGGFQSGFTKEWKRAYLATYPRSGNHWVRTLVEEASHIATGSVYCDKEPPHLKEPFPWGGFTCDHGYGGQCRYPTKNDLVLVKTHFPGQGQERLTKYDNLPYQIVIRIVRHPVDSFYSRYMHKYSKMAQKPEYEIVPTKKVKEFIKNWRDFENYWNKKENVITFRYEDILANPAVELKKICAALHYDVTDENIAEAVAKHPPQGFPLKHKNKFREEDLKLIGNELHDLMIQFDYTIP